MDGELLMCGQRWRKEVSEGVSQRTLTFARDLAHGLHSTTASVDGGAHATSRKPGETSKDGSHSCAAGVGSARFLAARCQYLGGTFGQARVDAPIISHGRLFETSIQARLRRRRSYQQSFGHRAAAAIWPGPWQSAASRHRSFR